jgi:YesN/AraC family two-component response regulator
MMEKILVIEDNAATRNLFLEYLKAKGFNAIGAENGLVGIQQAKEQLPDLITCDITMPELDGYGVLTAVRQSPLTAIIPFVFITARTTRNDIRKAMELGVDDYLTKPFTLEELLAAIATQLKKRAALQQWYGTDSQQTPEQPLDNPDNTAGSTELHSIFPACPRMAEVFRFIDENYHRAVTLCDVAQAVGYSPAYLTNLMRQQTGKSFYRWLVERRMSQAISLLLKTEQTVGQISQAVGYQDACHFSRYFRQFYGVSPQGWRSAHRVAS